MPCSFVLGPAGSLEGSRDQRRSVANLVAALFVGSGLLAAWQSTRWCACQPNLPGNFGVPDAMAVTVFAWQHGWMNSPCHVLVWSGKVMYLLDKVSTFAISMW